MELRMYYVTSATDCILVTLIISLCSIQYHSRFAAGKLIERGTFLTDWLDDFILEYNVCIMYGRCTLWTCCRSILFKICCCISYRYNTQGSFVNDLSVHQSMEDDDDDDDDDDNDDDDDDEDEDED